MPIDAIVHNKQKSLQHAVGTKLADFLPELFGLCAGQHSH